jgi:AraC-like DNA-binding protein
MTKQLSLSASANRNGWPPAAFFHTPATLLPGQEPDLLAYFRPSPRPFYLFGSAHIPPGTVTQAHSHPIVALHSCMQGPLTLLTPTGEHVLDAGVLYMIAPGMRHHWRNDGLHAAISMGFLIDTDHPGRWPGASGLPDCCRELGRLVRGLHRLNVAGDMEVQQVFWALADCLVSERPRRPMLVTGLMQTLIGVVLERLSPTSKVQAAHADAAKVIRRFLLSRMAERVSIEEVAWEVGLSPTRAKQVFHDTYGYGIIAYFNLLKIGQAKRLLCDPTLTVDQVSRKLGFSSASYFGRVFHHYTGQSPGDFRNQGHQT